MWKHWKSIPNKNCGSKSVYANLTCALQSPVYSEQKKMAWRVRELKHTLIYIKGWTLLVNYDAMKTTDSSTSC